MDGYTFYLEHRNNRSKRKGEHAGNCIAVYGEVYFICHPPIAQRECIAPLYNAPNSVCCGSAVALDILRERFKRVSEAKAREIHPRLFKYLSGEGYGVDEDHDGGEFATWGNDGP